MIEIMKVYYRLLSYITKKKKLQKLLSHFGFVPVIYSHMKAYISFFTELTSGYFNYNILWV